MKSAIIEAAEYFGRKAGQVICRHHSVMWGYCTECQDRVDEFKALAQRLRRAEYSPIPRPLYEWQPIETAPKDGTEFDVWCASAVDGDHGGYRVTDCWWSRVDQRFRSYGDDLISWAHPPTHWMPLPAPPASNNVGKESER